MKEAYKSEPILSMQGVNENEQVLKLISDTFLRCYKDYIVDNELSVVAIDETNGQDRIVGYLLCLDQAATNFMELSFLFDWV